MKQADKKKKKQKKAAQEQDAVDRKQTMGDDGFTMTTGRVIMAKQVRKLKDRKDSLDDISSSSSSEDEQPRRKGRKEERNFEEEEKKEQLKAQRQAEVEAEVAELRA